MLSTQPDSARTKADFKSVGDCTEAQVQSVADIETEVSLRAKPKQPTLTGTEAARRTTRS